MSVFFVLLYFDVESKCNIFKSRKKNIIAAPPHFFTICFKKFKNVILDQTTARVDQFVMLGGQMILMIKSSFFLLKVSFLEKISFLRILINLVSCLWLLFLFIYYLLKWKSLSTMEKKKKKKWIENIADNINFVTMFCYTNFVTLLFNYSFFF